MKILIEQTFFDVAKALADWRQTERMKRVEISLNAINKKIQDLEVVNPFIVYNEVITKK